MLNVISHVVYSYCMDKKIKKQITAKQITILLPNNQVGGMYFFMMVIMFTSHNELLVKSVLIYVTQMERR